MNIKERIQDLCKKKGVTANQAEKDLGVSASYISKLDKSAPTAFTLYNMAKYFDVTMEYILMGEEKPAHDKADELVDNEIIEMLTLLTPFEFAKVQGYLEGILAARKE